MPAKHSATKKICPWFAFPLQLWRGFAFVLLAHLSPAAVPQGEVLGKEGTVDFTRSKTNWSPAVIGQKLVVEDRLRTRELSRGFVQLAELGRFTVKELTTLEVLAPSTNNAKIIIDLKAGAMYFFTRDRPRQFLIRTPNGLAASEGTEFLVTVDPAGRDVFSVFDGRVELANQFGPSLLLTNREEGEMLPGLAPRKTAVLQGANLVQWWLYYPGVLDLDELPLTAAEQAALAASLAAYRSGDVLAALANYPAGRVPQSDAERVYYAAVLLATGQADKAELQLAAAPSQPAFVNALREVIAAVTLQPFPTNPATFATEWVARSYSQQAKFDLSGALASARNAAGLSTNFGFAWERVAELEFGFGHTRAARIALEKSLQFAPSNAQAWALEGFLAAADNNLRGASNSFQRAIDLDPALGNGWLGRGLVSLRLGHRAAGRRDLQSAAALEPNRSVLRSYLGKAFENNGEVSSAQKELRLAQELDSNDPTPWLYSALLLRQQLHFNEAVDHLEKSVALNDNRAVYRSRLLLDQDRAVRSSSLATIYQGVGMDDVSVREAARAVAADYANPSAHLFLAESFNALRDPTRFNLRIETAWFNELLLANILAPVAGGNLSQNISQQEYSRLFEGNRIGLSSFSEYRSDKQFRELASHFGTVGNTGYAFDLDYQHNAGVRPNNELDRLEWYTTLKHQITAQDSVLMLMKYQDYHSGDNFQYFDPKATDQRYEFFGVSNAPVFRKSFVFDEVQQPLLVGAYHHEWSPGVHTLMLGGRLENDQRFSDEATLQTVLRRSLADNHVLNAVPRAFNVDYRNEFEIFTGEFNQIIQTERQHLVLGGRVQSGEFNTSARLASAAVGSFGASSIFPGSTNSTEEPFERFSGYGYYTVEVFTDFLLMGGVAYDWLKFPRNFRAPPLQSGTETRDQFSPKAALVWSPRPEVTLRGVYSRALGGVSLDESFRLEPVQLAGFSQAFRTIIPETVAGSVSAPAYEVAGAALDVKLKTRTYLGVQTEWLQSEVRRDAGVFDFYPGQLPPIPAVPSRTRQRLDYDERSVAATVNQLLSDEWSFGTQYRFTRSKLQSEFPVIPIQTTEQADLHRVTLSLHYNHPSGFFARTESQWYHQENSAYPSLEFWQHNLFVGWRLRRQRGELSLGVLNLGDTDYRLNPLNLYAEMPRERVYVARLKFNF